MSVSIEQCLDLLPQTQCRECGHNGCQPYATALLDGSEPSIARCLPGGQHVADQLASLLNKAPETARPVPAESQAMINVEQCIGCSLCIKACPVDAIWGAQGFEHQVLEKDCTGCELCLPACPTACISLEPRSEGVPLPTAAQNLQRISQKEALQQQQRQKKWEAHRHALKKKQPQPQEC